MNEQTEGLVVTAARTGLANQAIVGLAGAVVLASIVGVPEAARPWAAAGGAALLIAALQFGARALPEILRRLGQVIGLGVAVVALMPVLDPIWLVGAAAVMALVAVAALLTTRPATGEPAPWVDDLHYALAALFLIAMPIAIVLIMNAAGWMGHDLGPVAITLAVVGLVQAASTRVMVHHRHWASPAALLGSRHGLVGVLLAGYMAFGSASDSRWPLPVCAGLMAAIGLVTAPAYRTESVIGLSWAAALVAAFEAAALLGWMGWLTRSGSVAPWVIGAVVMALVIDQFRGSHRHHHS